ncbi:MAG: hypothetical protein PHV71_03350 [Eubacteriales bacterium]|nr:hypothetical protein [Eubacteriales bacterium]MDD3199132.1 hypothetical protein [Eubacteriales bacterium]MDD4121956.1 hypothetical protein [Eubacteriales bacterium]MDD4629624.1 hypothetical protein [Eubacteriales bacterium]
MTERKFKVIKGGVAAAVSSNQRRFLSGFITDTRLMGVVGLYIHWELSNNESATDFHQFFYFDAEEYGFETYKSLLGDDTDALIMMEQTLLGGLGGIKVNVSEREAIFLVQKYVDMNKRLSLSLPETLTEYSFLLEKPITLSEEETLALSEKLCTPIQSEYQLINYYLMRIFGNDFEAAAYLSEDGILPDEPTGINGATLCKNSIDEYYDESGCSYLCESLIEYDGKYELVVSEIHLNEGKVSKMKRRSGFFITPAEAAMMLNHPEFITVYEILTEPEEFIEQFSRLSAASMQTLHENGRLYLEFNKNNDHVNRKVFRLNEDIHGLYYVTDYGQLIIAAYSLDEIHDIEKTLKKNEVGSCIIPTAKYEFKEPILYEFIQSDFDDFTDFLDFLNSDI